ncbi:MAG TPA: pullulanase-type alpha-1,6-glucosidase [Thermoanaerobaculia bacterium]|jgi:pullulanase-type alpha-1,6-glucosidase|nr:pullulanase-type alpha-1,6-glucosidase [Thermoanaerobaculia bacterium]
MPPPQSQSHPEASRARSAVRGNIKVAKAHWLTRDTIAWSIPVQVGQTLHLHYSANGSLALGDGGVTGGSSITLTPVPGGIGPVPAAKFPHLAGYSAFKIGAADLKRATALKGQIAVSATEADSTLIDATALQIPDVLDDLFVYDGPLGVTFSGNAPTLRVWAPTARSVALLLFNDSNPSTTPSRIPMIEDSTIGVWSVGGTPAWNRKFYLYEVEVFVRSSGAAGTNRVTDPYSLSLSTDSLRSQIVDLAELDLKPAGWHGVEKPQLTALGDATIYELHVRDFSISDKSVPAAKRGTFRAFGEAGSNGMRHLKLLAEAGLSHVHLLPCFDFATVPENPANRAEPAGDLRSFPSSSDRQQAAVAAVKDRDGFNWGYDPLLYTVPEGSYSTDPDGPERIREFREMVQGLNRAGLRVVMDVVYNHTHAAGQDAKSVLDRIVPGYYHRLNGDGEPETSASGSNTASERQMMEKLMVDSLLIWARDYKVDGFRFDLMGHHTKANLLKIRAALDALRQDRDGVDGSKIILYGEGWSFGEVANDARFVQAAQANMAGTGIGTFNDRLRDAARGGGPFSGIQEQGFLTGLFLDPNSIPQGSLAAQMARLLYFTDWIRVGLAGSLASYSFENAAGVTVAAWEIDSNGQPAGYTAVPRESINYIESHDNETLWDAIQLKAATVVGVAERVRMQNLGIALVGLGQGIPFFHAGVDLLRSKSLDRDSYNSGDWFNKIDWTYATNNWGVGLPPAEKNQGNWPVMRSLLADPALAIRPADIQSAVHQLREVLEIRKSSNLFHLPTAADVAARLHFWNTGPSQIPGVIAMTLTDADGAFDKKYRRIVVIWSARPDAVDLADSSLAGLTLTLHPVQQSSHDVTVRASTFSPARARFHIPGRTAAVFVETRRGEEEGDG